jgi:hypothetical protein
LVAGPQIALWINEVSAWCFRQTAHTSGQAQGCVLAAQALARCLQSFVAMTYLSQGQQSDSRRIYILKARGA